MLELYSFLFSSQIVPNYIQHIPLFLSFFFVLATWPLLMYSASYK